MLFLFLVVGGLGVTVLVVQIVLSLLGLDHDLSGDVDLADGLDLMSVRSLSAAWAMFGIGGLGGLQFGLPGWLAIVPGVIAGTIAAVGTAWLTRWMASLESSGSLRLESAVGRAGMVHLSVPPGLVGAGRVQFELQGRTLELKAVSPAGPLPVGTPVTIVGLVDDDTVEVMPTPTLEEIIG
jgi:hypothetical protein